MPLHHRFGLGDFDRNPLRHFHRNRDAVEGLDRTAHAFLKVDLVGPEHGFGHDNLIVGRRLHEVKAFAVFIEKIVIPFVNAGLFDHLGRAPAFRHFHTVRNPAHVDGCCGRALAGVEVGGGQNDVKPAVHLDDIAFAQAGSDDFHELVLVMEGPVP